MTMQHHPITPTPEQVDIWFRESRYDLGGSTNWVAVRAAQWGADQELNACCAFLHDNETCDPSSLHKILHDHRRPQLKSNKQQALKAFNEIYSATDPQNKHEKRRRVDKLRAILENLPE